MGVNGGILLCLCCYAAGKLMVWCVVSVNGDIVCTCGGMCRVMVVCVGLTCDGCWVTC